MNKIKTLKEKRKNEKKYIGILFNVIQVISLAVFIVMGTVFFAGIGQYGSGESSIRSEIKSRMANMNKIALRYCSLRENKDILKKMNYQQKLEELSTLKKKYFSDSNSNYMFIYNGISDDIKYNTGTERVGYDTNTDGYGETYDEYDFGEYKFKFDGKKIYNDAIRYLYEAGVDSGDYDTSYKETIIRKLKKIYPYERTDISFRIFEGNLLCQISYDDKYADRVYNRGELENDFDGIKVDTKWGETYFFTYSGNEGENGFTGEFRKAILKECAKRNNISEYDIVNGKFQLGSCSAYEKNDFYYVRVTQYKMRSYNNFVKGSIRRDLRTGDGFYYLFWYKDHEHLISFLTYFSGVLLIISTICIAISSRTVQDGESRLKLLYRLPADIMLIVTAGVTAALISLVISNGIDIEKIKSILKYGIPNVIVCGIAVCIILGIFITMFYTSFCAQVKAGILIDTMFITKVILSFAKTVKAVLSMVKLSVIVFAAYWVAGIIEGILAVVSGSQIAFFTVLVSKILGTVIIARILRDISKLHKGIEQISTGGVDGKINTQGMMLPIKMEAEALNNISDGMKKAIESQMKSERMKTELITNVSHDIKTPVTAIISYVDLLKKEDLQNKTAAGYVDVLDRQSLRLKNLIYDLLDLSKSSTGNVEVNMTKLGLAVFIEQSLGEYISKFEKKNLIPIVNFRMDDDTKNELEINADGRHLSRVFDNIFQNINKYAMPDTRVYIDVELSGKEQDSETEVLSDKVIITVKNMSEMPLNLSGDELMERFVRGDESRNTEGSGLGLSIAQNLMQLQNGNLEVFVDGDLFKVVITLSRAVELGD